jgi:predicted SAM-dependent methyltransferase
MIKLNLGCGWRNFGSDWVHIDGGDYPHLDSTDIINLPYPDNSVDVIYSSHTLEYFNRTEVKDVLSIWRNKLKPGGILRLAVPNFEVLAKLYAKDKISLSQVLGPLYGQMLMGDETIYHKTTYDYKSLESLLLDLNFNNIKSYNWEKTEHFNLDDFSQSYIPHMDKENGVLTSLNVEAIK